MKNMENGMKQKLCPKSNFVKLSINPKGTREIVVIQWGAEKAAEPPMPHYTIPKSKEKNMTPAHEFEKKFQSSEKLKIYKAC